MRITFVLPSEGLAGGNKVVAIYSDRLIRRGHQVTVVAGRAPSPPLSRRLISLVREGRRKEPSPTPSYFHDLSVPIREIEASRPIVDSDLPDADVVIATWWETAEWVSKLTPEKGTKVHFIQHHEVLFAYVPVERCRAVYQLPLHKIVISKWLKEAMLAVYGDEKAHLILNSVDTAQFFAPIREKSLVPTIGFLYSTVSFKGLEILLPALERLKQIIPNVRGVAFGAEGVSEKMPLPEWVEFHHRPPQSEIRLLYAKCDLWICASHSEGFHLPPLEAMACRCPLVSTSVGGPADIIEDGVNGFLVKVEDFSSLADRAACVLQLGAEGWKSMSDAALNTALRYSWDDATDLFETALFEFVSGASLPHQPQAPVLNQID